MAKEIWGYARVSTKEQNLERQLVELKISFRTNNRAKISTDPAISR